MSFHVFHDAIYLFIYLQFSNLQGIAGIGTTLLGHIGPLFVFPTNVHQINVGGRLFPHTVKYLSICRSV